MWQETSQPWYELELANDALPNTIPNRTTSPMTVLTIPVTVHPMDTLELDLALEKSPLDPADVACIHVHAYRVYYPISILSMHGPMLHACICILINNDSH